MSFTSKSWKLLPVFVLSLFLLPDVTQAQHYKQTNLVSDIAGMAPTVDPNLKNPWGLTRSSGSPWWVGNNNSGTSTVYGSDGTTAIPAGFLPDPPGSPFDNFVIVPSRFCPWHAIRADRSRLQWQQDRFSFGQRHSRRLACRLHFRHRRRDHLRLGSWR